MVLFSYMKQQSLYEEIIISIRKGFIMTLRVILLGLQGFYHVTMETCGGRLKKIGNTTGRECITAWFNNSAITQVQVNLALGGNR